MGNKSDFLIRGVIGGLNIRFSFVETTATVTEAIIVHSADPLCALTFGKALTIGTLISPLLNGDEKYSIKWEYEGLLGSILVDVNSKCEVRGIPKETMIMDRVETNDELYGENGQITMIKADNGKILNSGTSAAGLLDIGDDISFYMATSDQLETEFLTSASFNPDPEHPVKMFAGLMIQALPDCDLEKFDELRSNIQLGNGINVLDAKDLPVEKKLWKLIETIVGEKISYSEIDEKYGVSYEFSNSPAYVCPCNRDKMKAAVMLLDKPELMEIFDNNEEPRITCQFCNTKYVFSKDEFDLD